MRGCRAHCWVWRWELGAVVIGCAHCDEQRAAWVPVDAAGDEKRAAATVTAHEQRCRRAARLPVLRSPAA